MRVRFFNSKAVKERHLKFASCLLLHVGWQESVPATVEIESQSEPEPVRIIQAPSLSIPTVTETMPRTAMANGKATVQLILTGGSRDFVRVQLAS